MRKEVLIENVLNARFFVTGNVQSSYNPPMSRVLVVSQSFKELLFSVKLTNKTKRNVLFSFENGFVSVLSF